MPYWKCDFPVHGRETIMSNAKFSEPANILCVGDRWLLSKPGGLQHYLYELTHHLIPGGMDTTYFRPNLSRQEARVQLNWPSDRFCLLLAVSFTLWDWINYLPC